MYEIHQKLDCFFFLPRKRIMKYACIAELGSLVSKPVLISIFPFLGLDLGLEVSFLCLVLSSAPLALTQTLIHIHCANIFFSLSLSNNSENN